MFSYVLFSVLNMCLFVHSDIYYNYNYNIQLELTEQTYLWRSNYDIERIFVVLEDKPVVIKLLNYGALNINCGSMFYPYIPYMTNFREYDEFGVVSSIGVVPRATADMTGRWHCFISRFNPIYALKITFRVRVKSSSTRRVGIEIGGRLVDTSLTDASELAYDEVATYSYWNGETVDLVCYNEQHDGMIYLRYYDTTGTLVVRTSNIKGYGNDNNNILFQATLYTVHNNSMIDCTYVTPIDGIEFSYRIIFTQNIIKPSYGNFKVAINNSQLISDQNLIADGVRTSRYHYMFFPEENLKITCDPLNDGDLKPTFYTGPPNDLIPFNGIEKKTEINLNQLEIEFNEKFTITCAAVEAGQFKLMAYILLIKREPPKLQVLGLNRKYVNVQYTLTNTDWRIHYRYSPGQVLNITCIASDIGYLQLFESTQISYMPVMARSINKIFRLGVEHSNSTLICRYREIKTNYNRQVMITLRMQDAVSSRLMASFPSLTRVNATDHPSTDIPGDVSDETRLTTQRSNVSSRLMASTPSLPKANAPDDPSTDTPVIISEVVEEEVGDEAPLTTPQSDDKRDSQFTINLVIGCVVPLLLLVVIGLLVYYRRYKYSRTEQTDGNQPQEVEPTPPVDMASNPDTCDHEYQYIDFEDTRPKKKRERCPLNKENGDIGDKDNRVYDYAYVSAGRSEVKRTSRSSIASAQNNTTYFWINQ